MKGAGLFENCQFLCVFLRFRPLNSNPFARNIFRTHHRTQNIKTVRESIGRKDRTFRGEYRSKKRFLTRGHARRGEQDLQMVGKDISSEFELLLTPVFYWLEDFYRKS